jgi:hypothetical protein
MSSHDYTRYLELLKLRFGEEHMTQCDVMLKDIADSKRITSRIREDLRDSPEVGTFPPGFMRHLYPFTLTTRTLQDYI